MCTCVQAARISSWHAPSMCTCVCRRPRSIRGTGHCCNAGSELPTVRGKTGPGLYFKHGACRDIVCPHPRSGLGCRCTVPTLCSAAAFPVGMEGQDGDGHGQLCGHRAWQLSSVAVTAGVGGQRGDVQPGAAVHHPGAPGARPEASHCSRRTDSAAGEAQGWQDPSQCLQCPQHGGHRKGAGRGSAGWSRTGTRADAERRQAGAGLLRSCRAARSAAAVNSPAAMQEPGSRCFVSAPAASAAAGREPAGPLEEAARGSGSHIWKGSAAAATTSPPCPAPSPAAGRAGGSAGVGSGEATGTRPHGAEAHGHTMHTRSHGCTEARSTRMHRGRGTHMDVRVHTGTCVHRRGGTREHRDAEGHTRAHGRNTRPPELGEAEPVVAAWAPSPAWSISS